MAQKKPVALIILDGYGLSPTPEGDATKAAKTPTMANLWENCPNATLQASGASVGLMDGQMGDSNVGHLNIGAGRIVYQDVARISKSVKDGDFFRNEALVQAMSQAKDNGGKLHLMGLISPGGVHSHTDHLYALLEMAKGYGLNAVYIHCFLDGRDVPPSSAKGFLADLEAKINQVGIGQVATISGRYYAMDRDKRWDRLEKAYLALVDGQGREVESTMEAIDTAYANGETDEFVIPTVIKENGDPVAKIENGDSIVFFNFRADRAREITWAFINEDFEGFLRPGGRLDIRYTTMTQYDSNVQAPYAFSPQDLKNTLGEYLANQGKRQLRIAETEKYAHVTFFLNGGVEEPFAGEDRKLISSPKVATYDMQPEMSAPEVTQVVVEAINSGTYDLIVLNYANCDMVGHTGDVAAAVTAVEAVDAGLGKVLAALEAQGGQALITADHGNAEQMIDPDTKQPHTAHTSNPVPIWFFNGAGKKVKSGILGDLAPSLLDLMGLDKPVEMSGTSLITD